MDYNKITIQASIEADKQKVWNFYTMPEHIIHWNFASPDWCCPSATNDMQVGGKYSARMEAKDGSFAFDFEAIYNEVIDGESFTYTMLDGRTVIISFSENNHQTEVQIIFDAETENSLELQRDGWQAILNNFKSYSETNA
jgi:uncharacterized protein YndB with AHSA1/START domain